MNVKSIRLPISSEMGRLQFVSCTLYATRYGGVVKATDKSGKVAFSVANLRACNYAHRYGKYVSVDEQTANALSLAIKCFASVKPTQAKDIFIAGPSDVFDWPIVVWSNKEVKLLSKSAFLWKTLELNPDALDTEKEMLTTYCEESQYLFVDRREAEERSLSYYDAKFLTYTVESSLEDKIIFWEHPSKQYSVTVTFSPSFGYVLENVWFRKKHGSAAAALRCIAANENKNWDFVLKGDKIDLFMPEFPYLLWERIRTII